MRTTDRIKLVPVLASEMWRRGRLRWKSRPYFAVSLPASTLPKQTIFPNDLRHVQPERAEDYYAGRFWFGDDGVELHGDSPFSCDPPSEEWSRRLHGFRWLRHLSGANNALARAQGSSLIGDWIRLCDRRRHPVAHESAVIADRLIAWCCHAHSLMSDAGDARRHDLRRSIAVQVRYLQNIQTCLAVDRDRLKTTLALTYVALCFGAREKALKLAQRDLAREIDRQILADGGHISRNPAVLVDVLADMWPLLDTFSRYGQAPHDSLISAVDRMAGALRFFRHTDGTLAQFNGTGLPSQTLLANLLDEPSSATDILRRKVQQSAPFTGYERLSRGNTVILADTGAPVSRHAARDAAAGCLAFEMSSGKNRFIINVGKPKTDAARYAPYWRVTPAHSTASINGRSSVLFARNKKMTTMLPSPALAWPNHVTRDRRTTDGFDVLEASHDGFAGSEGFVHHRSLSLSKKGNEINGADRFEQVASHNHGQKTEVTLRFHLPPTISASILANGHSILLAAPDREAWTFICVDADIALEESVHFAHSGGARKSEQIVVRADVCETREIRWALVRRTRQKAPRSKGKPEGVASPDLLSSLEETGEKR